MGINSFRVRVPSMYWLEFETLCQDSKLDPEKMASAIIVQFVKNWLKLGCPDVFREVREGNGCNSMVNDKV